MESGAAQREGEGEREGSASAQILQLFRMVPSARLGQQAAQPQRGSTAVAYGAASAAASTDRARRHRTRAVQAVQAGELACLRSAEEVAKAAQRVRDPAGLQRGAAGRPQHSARAEVGFGA